MKSDDSVRREANSYVEKRGLLLLLIAVSFAFGWILLPLFGPILWGAIIALLFAPSYRWLLARLHRRRTLAALLTLTIVLVSVILPIVLVIASVAREATLVYQLVDSGNWDVARYLRGLFEALPGWARALLDRFGFDDFDSIRIWLMDALVQTSRLIATQTLSLGLNTFQFVAKLFVALYLAFFLIRDGEAIARSVRNAVPLAPTHKRELFETFAMVIRATVRGNFLVAAAQGTLGGLAFWYLGVDAALLWAVLMGFLSLIPAGAAGLVWAPVAIYFLATGSVWQGLALVAYGVLVIGLVDNLLGPMLVGQNTRMPDYLVMITTLGGMVVFGINGFILGPTIGAMFIAVWHIHSTTLHGGSP